MSSTKPHKKYNILMAGGGTGGHVMPIANIIHMIDKNHQSDTHIFRYGGSSSLEHKVATKLTSSLSTSVTFRSIFSGKIRRDHSLSSLCRNIWDMVKVAIGTLQALWYCKRDSIDVIFCKGGYVAGPVIVASRVRGIPLVTHESDTRMGLINRIASRHSRAIFTAFDDVHHRGQVVGQLLSDTLAHESKRSSFADLLGVDTLSSKTHILVMGGSQGSQSLYQSLAQVMRMRPDIYQSYVFVVIGGLLSQDLHRMFQSYDNVVVLDFLAPEQLRLCYQYCDIALTRAGTTSLAEQKLWDMLLVMVPIPWTHDQKTNAQRYVEHHGDMMIEQNEVLPHQLDMVFSALHVYKKSVKYTAKKRLEVIQEPKKKVIQTLFTFAQ